MLDKPSFRACGTHEIDACAVGFKPTLIVAMVEGNAHRAARALDADLFTLLVPDLEGGGDSPWAKEAVGRLLAWGRDLRRHDRVLVHCAAGVSRSPAAALLMEMAWLSRNGTVLDAKVINRLFVDFETHRPHFLPNGSLLAAGEVALGIAPLLSEARRARTGRLFATLSKDEL